MKKLIVIMSISLSGCVTADYTNCDVNKYSMKWNYNEHSCIGFLTEELQETKANLAKLQLDVKHLKETRPKEK